LDAAREREDLRTALEGRVQAAEAELARSEREHSAALEHIQADAARERDELRAVLDARAQAIEEARADWRARAGRAEAELDQARAELAALRAGGQKDDDAHRPAPRRTRRASPPEQP